MDKQKKTNPLIQLADKNYAFDTKTRKVRNTKTGRFNKNFTFNKETGKFKDPSTGRFVSRTLAKQVSELKSIYDPKILMNFIRSQEHYLNDMIQKFETGMNKSNKIQESTARIESNISNKQGELVTIAQRDSSQLENLTDLTLETEPQLKEMVKYSKIETNILSEILDELQRNRLNNSAKGSGSTESKALVPYTGKGDSDSHMGGILSGILELLGAGAAGFAGYKIYQNLRGARSPKGLELSGKNSGALDAESPTELEGSSGPTGPRSVQPDGARPNFRPQGAPALDEPFIDGELWKDKPLLEHLKPGDVAENAVKKFIPKFFGEIFGKALGIIGGVVIPSAGLGNNEIMAGSDEKKIIEREKQIMHPHTTHHKDYDEADRGGNPGDNKKDQLKKYLADNGMDPKALDSIPTISGMLKNFGINVPSDPVPNLDHLGTTERPGLHGTPFNPQPENGLGPQNPNNYSPPSGGDTTTQIPSNGPQSNNDYGPPSTAITGKDFKEKSPKIIANLQSDFGLTKDQAAGIVGNLGHESGGFKQMQEVNPTGGGAGGYGWAQWTGPRRQEYFAWAKANNLDPKSDEANYGFLKHELSTSYKGAIDAVKKTNNYKDSTVAFEQNYEKAGVKAYNSRMNYAGQALDASNQDDKNKTTQVASDTNAPKLTPQSGDDANAMIKGVDDTSGSKKTAMIPGVPDTGVKLSQMNEDNSSLKSQSQSAPIQPSQVVHSPAPKGKTDAGPPTNMSIAPVRNDDPIFIRAMFGDLKSA